MTRWPGREKACLLLVLLCAVQPGGWAQKAATGRISGTATYELTKQLLAVAPKRFNGSPGHAAAEQFIKAHFAPEIAKGRFETDQFIASTPAGMQTMRNFIVRYPGKKDGVIVLASHYETNYPLKDIGFVGANDGACTSALLMKIGEYYRAHPPEGYSVWLVFDDGEEAVKSWSDSDSLYGTRHLAAKWSQDGTLGKIKAFVVADMIGDKDLNIDKDGNSTPALESMLQEAARNTGHATHVFKEDFPSGIQDDHLPFQKRGVPVLDIIDIDYGPKTSAMPDGYHHTAEDTIDKISPQSLQIAGDLLMEVIRLVNQR
jgi:Zn-dependent M28 family amino/carboxypeptidase